MSQGSCLSVYCSYNNYLINIKIYFSLRIIFNKKDNLVNSTCVFNEHATVPKWLCSPSQSAHTILKGLIAMWETELYYTSRSNPVSPGKNITLMKLTVMQSVGAKWNYIVLYYSTVWID